MRASGLGNGYTRMRWAGSHALEEWWGVGVGSLEVTAGLATTLFASSILACAARAIFTATISARCGHGSNGLNKCPGPIMPCPFAVAHWRKGDHPVGQVCYHGRRRGGSPARPFSRHHQAQLRALSARKHACKPVTSEKRIDQFEVPQHKVRVRARAVRAGVSGCKRSVPKQSAHR